MGAPLTPEKARVPLLTSSLGARTSSETGTVAVRPPAAEMVTDAVYVPFARPSGSTPTGSCARTSRSSPTAT
jgi:hypothetical protein